MRLNVYLSRDGSFVTIWNGLVEPMLAEARFEIPALPSFQDIYCEPQFRGHIEWHEDAATILHAIRIQTIYPNGPEILTGAPNDLCCEPLPAEEGRHMGRGNPLPRVT